ncbi:MAG: type II toxin-antitoxin system Phd/YefM family antitoxin [Parachlamydiaceae bacterium]|nr:type II toxin-antitoxin system Phd/YefM family antitoxin [Parachlamydiaceae bacterium]
MNSSQAREHFPELVSEAAFAKKRFIITRRGKNLAAVIPIEDLEMIEALEDKIDLEDARKALIDVKKNGSIPWKKLKAKLGL